MPGGLENIVIVGWHERPAGNVHSWIGQVGPYNVKCFINPEDTPLEVVKTTRRASQFDYPRSDSFKGQPLYNYANWPRKLHDLGIRSVIAPH